MLVKEKAEKDTGLGNRSDETERGKKIVLQKFHFLTVKCANT